MLTTKTGETVFATYQDMSIMAIFLVPTLSGKPSLYQN